jgi:hypothetical protein
VRHDLLLPHRIPTRCECDVKLFERAFVHFHEEEVGDWYEGGVEDCENAVGKDVCQLFFFFDSLALAVCLALTCTFSNQGSPSRAG